MKRIQLFMVFILMVALQGCALWGSSTPADSPTPPAPQAEAETKATVPASATTPTQASPTSPVTAVNADVAEAQALWTGVRCAKPAEAETKLNAIIQARPQDTTALALRGLARSELGKKEEAFDDLTAAVRAAPTARNYALRGLALWRAGNEKAAQIDAHYALRKDKQEPVAHLVLGLAARKLGDAAKGCEELRLACQGGECADWKEAQSAGQCK